MVMLVSAEELASHLQRDDLDRATAEQAITTVSSWVESQAGWAFSPRTAELRLPATYASFLSVPVRKPLRSVDAVVIDGVAVTDWWLGTPGGVYRQGGWRPNGWAQPIDLTVTFGLDACPDDVKGVVYELAGLIVDNPTALTSERIGDLAEQYRDQLSAMSQATLTAYGARTAGHTAHTR